MTRINQILLNFMLLIGLIFSANVRAMAPTTSEQNCVDGFKNIGGWSEKSARTLCKNTVNSGRNLACLIQMSMGVKSEFMSRAPEECSGLATKFGYASYISNPFVMNPADTENPWVWVGGSVREIVNPLDGGLVLEYSMTSQGNADGCSGGAPREKKLFHQACLAHDNNYDAPFALAGFPEPLNGGLSKKSIGKRIADDLFLSDMKLIVDNERANLDGASNWINDQAAFVFYRVVEQLGVFREKSPGKTVISNGGIVMVDAAGSYLVDIRLKWNSPRSNERQQTVLSRQIGQPYVLLSADATNIELEVLSSELPFDARPGPEGYKTIFSRNYAKADMYTFTVGGSHGDSWVLDGLNAEAPKKTAYQVAIKTANEAGAGTDSNIFLRICGEQGCTLERRINSMISGDAFERNQVDRFAFLDFVDVGKITKIEIRSSMDYAGAAWKFESIQVGTGSQTKSALYNKYIDNESTVRFDVQ